MGLCNTTSPLNLMSRGTVAFLTELHKQTRFSWYNQIQWTSNYVQTGRSSVDGVTSYQMTHLYCFAVPNAQHVEHLTQTVNKSMNPQSHCKVGCFLGDNTVERELGNYRLSAQHANSWKLQPLFHHQIQTFLITQQIAEVSGLKLLISGSSFLRKPGHNSAFKDNMS